MGRPINKNKIGSGSGKIRVSRHFFTGASEASAVAWIVNQRSTVDFTVSDGVTTEVLTLIENAGGGLVAGQCAIDLTLNDSSVVQVTKLRNRTVQYGHTVGDSTDGDQIWYEFATGVDDGDNATDRAIIDTQP